MSTSELAKPPPLLAAASWYPLETPKGEDGPCVGLVKPVESTADDVRLVQQQERRDAERLRLYKRRFAGLLALVLFNIVAAINWVLFTTIANQTAAQFEISLTEVNWLSNIVCGMYVLAAPCAPVLLRRLGLRGVCSLAASCLVLGAWLRYAAAAASSERGPAYALLFVGSLFIGIGQCFLQIVPPVYSEAWFNLNGRTTAVMICAIANPFGGAISNLLSPGIVASDGTPAQFRLLLLIAAIISSVCAPLVFAIGDRPPTPPTRAAGVKAEETTGLGAAFLGLLGVRGRGRALSWRERADFWVIAYLFATIVGFFDAFLTLINQIFEPVGYDSDTAGFVGAAVIISGLVSAGVTSPLFDRFARQKLALCAKVLVPIIGIAFFAYTWVVRPGGIVGAYVLGVLMGMSAFAVLPVAIELAAEVAWGVAGTELTSSILYLLANAFSVITVVAMNALRADDQALPPRNMHKALLFQGIFVFVSSFAIFGVKGLQARQILDLPH